MTPLGATFNPVGRVRVPHGHFIWRGYMLRSSANRFIPVGMKIAGRWQVSSKVGALWPAPKASGEAGIVRSTIRMSLSLRPTLCCWHVADEEQREDHHG